MPLSICRTICTKKKKRLRIILYTVNNFEFVPSFLSTTLVPFTICSHLTFQVNMQQPAIIKKKIVGTPDVIYYNYIPMLTTAVKNGTWHCLIKSRGVLAFTIILPHPRQISVGGSGKASDNMTWINIALGERGFFCPKSDKVSQPFFQDCGFSFFAEMPLYRYYPDFRFFQWFFLKFFNFFYFRYFKSTFLQFDLFSVCFMAFLPKFIHFSGFFLQIFRILEWKWVASLFLKDFKIFKKPFAHIMCFRIQLLQLYSL